MPSLARPPVFPLPTPALYLSSSFLCLQAQPSNPRSPQPGERQINPSPGQQHRKYIAIRKSLAIPAIVFNDPLNFDNSLVIVQTRNCSKYLRFSHDFSHLLVFPIFLPIPSVYFINLFTFLYYSLFCTVSVITLQYRYRTLLRRVMYIIYNKIPGTVSTWYFCNIQDK